MAIYNYKAGIGNTASYQASGTPFVTGSDNLSGIMRIQFPAVTKELSFFVENGKSIDVYFHTAATTANKFTIEGNIETGQHTLDVKCKEVFVETSVATIFRVFASLTGIDPVQMPPLTGSGITE
tara:strand:- start:134 stop:505 length:372 start_codon:yes stop_codon:yes gene_type:complete